MGNKSRLYALAKQAQETLSDKDVMQSPEFVRYLQDTSKNIIAGTGSYLRRQGYAISDFEINSRAKTVVQVVNSEIPNNGWTTGMAISINTNGVGFKQANTCVEKVKTGYGTVIHEGGHIIFTDFQQLNYWNQQLHAGTLFPKEPDGYRGSFMETVFQQNRNAVIEILDDIQNCMEDGFIESELCLEFPGTIKQILQERLQAMVRRVPAFDAQLQQPEDILDVLHNQILIYAKAGQMKLGRYSGPCMPYLEQIRQVIDSVRYDKNFDNRLDGANKVCVLYFECIKTVCGDSIPKNQPKQNPQNTGDSGSSDSGEGNDSSGENSMSDDKNEPENGSDSQPRNLTPKDIENILNKLVSKIKDKRKEMGNEMVSTGMTKSIFGTSNNPASKSEQEGDSDEDDSSGEDGSANDGNSSSQQGQGSSDEDENSKADAAMASLLERLKKEIAQRRAEEQLEKERLNNQQQSTKSVKLYRKTAVTQEEIQEYNRLAPRVLPVSRRLQRSILELFKNRRDGSTNRNLFMGQRFEANKVINQSGRYFMKKNLPTERPKLRVDVLVDTSGSTVGKTIQASILTCIAIEDFCRNLSITNRIMSYTSDDTNCDCHLMVEPEKITNTDKYRIVSMIARGGTPTLAAVQYALDSLYGADEEYKLLIVITDGTGSDNHNDALQEEVKKAKRRGISVIAAGIGESKSGIQKEFGRDNFMDISDLDLMPKRLCSLIKRMMPL